MIRPEVRRGRRRLPWPQAGATCVLLGLALRSEALLNLAAMILVVGAVSSLWSRFALSAVRLERTLSRSRLFEGETLALSLRVANEKLLPVAWLAVVDHVPDRLGYGKARLGASERSGCRTLRHLTAMVPYQHVTWRHRVRCRRRGIYMFGPAELSSGDLFGLYGVRRTDPQRARLVVYPRVRPLRELGFPAREPLFGRRTRRPVVRDPLRPIGVREHRPEDPRRDVHWKATARRGDLQVKLLEPVSARSVLLVLNVATFERYAIGVDARLQEHAISVAASLASHAARRGHSIGLSANGSGPGTGRAIRVAPARDRGALKHVLEGLAAVTAYVVSPIERHLAVERGRAAWGATLVVVTPIVTEALRRELLRLRRAGRTAVLVSLDPRGGRGVPGVRTYALPAPVGEADRRDL